MKTLTHSDLADMVEAQLLLWPLAKKDHDALRAVKMKQLDAGDLRVGVLYNPARMVSTGAATDAASISRRPCFLCKGNRPKEQMAMEIAEGWELCMNPYPIFPLHFTIISKEHRPQGRPPYEMASMAEMMPDMVVFFNGAKAGASAPDHLHLQAILKSELPIVALAEKIHKPGGAPITASSDSGLCLPFLFYSAIITPDEPGMKTLQAICSVTGADSEGNADPGLVNVYFWMGSEGLLRAVAVPRKAHRPGCYGFEEDGFVISPGAVDMGGYIIAPREKDFERLDADKAWEIYGDVGYR